MIELRDDWKAYRKRAGLTQEEAAQMLGIARSALASFEMGRTYPKGTSMLRLMEVLYPGLGKGEGGGGRRDTFKCGSCGTTVPGPDQGGLYCLSCGAHQGDRCVSCGAANRDGAKFCDECGTPMPKA